MGVVGRVERGCDRVCVRVQVVCGGGVRCGRGCGGSFSVPAIIGECSVGITPVRHTATACFPSLQQFYRVLLSPRGGVAVFAHPPVFLSESTRSMMSCLIKCPAFHSPEGAGMPRRSFSHMSHMPSPLTHVLILDVHLDLRKRREVCYLLMPHAAYRMSLFGKLESVYRESYRSCCFSSRPGEKDGRRTKVKARRAHSPCLLLFSCHSSRG